MVKPKLWACTKILVLVMLLSLVCSQPFMYDPTVDSATPTVLRSHSQVFKWFYKRAIASSPTSFEYVEFDSQSTTALIKLTYSTTATSTLKALSVDFTCAVLSDASAGSQTLEIVKYDIAAPFGNKIEDLIVSGRVTAVGAASKSYQVSDFCTALKIDNTVYHFDESIFSGTGVSAFIADTIPTGASAWTGPVFSQTFEFVAANQGLYRYTPRFTPGTSGNYAKLSVATSFLTNKKILTTANAILVFSWVATADPNIKNWKVDAFSIPLTGSTFTSVGTFSGSSYDTTANAAPTIVVSSTMKTVIVYGKVNSTGNFIRGKVFDYLNIGINTSQELSFPAWMTDTANVFDVSDTYLYARNIDFKVGTASKFHGGYYIFGNQLYENFKPVALSAGELTDWVKSLVYETPSNQLRVVRQHVAANVVTLIEELHPADGRITAWDKTEGVVGVVMSGDGTSFDRIEGKGNWFFVSKPDITKNKFYSISLNQITGASIVVSAETDPLSTLKVWSQNMKCALIYDDTNFKTYSFDKTSTTIVTDIRTIPAALYTGVTIDGTTVFHVSDDCKGVRINLALIHFYDGGGQYFADTFPAANGVSKLVNPAFSEDFSVAVVDTGIYLYTPKTATVSGSYTLARTETFETKKSVWRSGNYLVIFSYVQSAIAAGKYNFKLQFNTISGVTVTKLNQFTGQTSQVPLIQVSSKMTKAMIYGKSSTDATKPFYLLKSVDWSAPSVKDVVLPTTFTDKFNKISISDEFLYVRNVLDSDGKHYGYAFFGSAMIESFDEDIPRISPDYARSFLTPDPINKKMMIVYEFTNDNYIRLVRDTRRSNMELINPNPTSLYEMSFSFPNTATYRMQQSPSFGKFFYTSDSGTKLNYVEYSIVVPENKLSSTSPSISGGNNIIRAVSPMMDCAVLYVNGGAVYNLAQVTENGAAITVTNQMSTIVTGNVDDLTVTQVSNAASTTNGIMAGNDCWAYKIGSLIYVKGTTTYAKSTVSASAAFFSAVYDSNLKFAYAGGKLYKYTTNDFAEIVSVSGLQSTVVLYPSLDNNKLLVVSYQMLATPPGYQFVNKLYALSGTTWSEVTLPSGFGSFSTAVQMPQIVWSPYLGSLLAFYEIGTELNKKNACYAVDVKYRTNQIIVNSYTVPTLFDSISTSSKIRLFDGFLHLNKIFGSQKSEIIYRLDDINFRFVELSRRVLTDNQFANFKNAKFVVDASDQLTVISWMQSESAGVISVNLVKSMMGGIETPPVTKGIESRDGGVLLQSGQVVLCPPGCAECVSATTCTKCMTGFGLSGGICGRCAPLCVSCDPSLPLACVGGCVDGYYPEAAGGGMGLALGAPTSCKRCDDSCLTCSAGSKSDCIKCKVGFYALQVSGPLNVCVPCIENCVTCGGSSTSPLCSICKLGYVFSQDTKTCVKCIAGCTNCKPEKVSECINCGEGFEPVFLNGTLQSCKPCPPKCKICMNGQCSQCRQGFRLVNNNCIEQCRLPCVTCFQNDATKCTTCPVGYTLNNVSCLPDLSCNTLKTCTSCPLGYNLGGRECVQCNGGPNCRLCDITNVDKCAFCVKGFYLTSTATCAQCNILGCIDCVNEAYCNECKLGYVMTGVGSSAKCTKCDDSCETCFDSPSNCDKCAGGYTKRGWKCVNNNYIKVNVTIDRVFASLTTSDYVKMEQDLSDRTGQDKSQINIEVLRSGSVVLEATINVVNLVHQAAVMTALSNSFSINSTMGGYIILGSSFVASLVDTSSNSTTIITNTTNNTNGNTTTIYKDVYVPVTDEAKAKEYRDIAVIVGIVIPIGLSNFYFILVIIFIVLFILYKKRIIFSENSSVKVRDVSLNHIEYGHKEYELKESQTIEKSRFGESSLIENGYIPKDSAVKIS